MIEPTPIPGFSIKRSPLDIHIFVGIARSYNLESLSRIVPIVKMYGPYAPIFVSAMVPEHD